MDKVIVKFEGNWADEMDISGFEIFDRSQWDIFSQKILDYTHELHLCIGTNEHLEYETTEEFMDNITVESLTRDEYNVINNKVGVRFGFEMIKKVVSFIDHYKDGIPEHLKYV